MDERAAAAAAAMAQLPDSFPEAEVNNALSFFQRVKEASDPAVYEEFLRLLRGITTGNTPDSREEVKTKVYALLQGHPNLVHRLHAFFPAPDPAREDPAPMRPKRERRPTATAAAVDDAADVERILRYFKRVSRRGAELYDGLMELLFHVRDKETLNGHQIYEQAREVFGSENSDLLRVFTGYLPIPTGRERDLFLRRRANKEPAPEEHRAPAPKRKAAAGIAADNPSAAKRLRADRRTTNRRAHSPVIVDAAPKSGGVSAFREAWEFETTYTKLVATARRTKELVKEYDPSEDAPPPRGRRAFEELFPSRECQEVLREMYHGMLGPIREALEDGTRTELALRTIKRRLGMLEQVAVKMAMERRDRARVEGRMDKLAVDRVLVLRNNHAKQSAAST